MRSIFSLMLLVSLSWVAVGQTEMVIPWSDSFSLFNSENIVDDNGNVYVLGTLYLFDNTPGMPIEGLPTIGSVLVKLDNKSNIVFKKLYKTASINGYMPSGLQPAKQLFLRDTSIFIPYNTYLGDIPCTTDPNYSFPISRNGGLVTGLSDGVVIRNEYFNDDLLCSDDDLYYSAVDKKGGIMYVYGGLGGVLHVNKRDKDLSNISISSFPENGTLQLYNFSYDCLSDNFLSRRGNVLEIYNSDLELSGKIMFPDSIPVTGNSTCIAYSNNYYAINIANRSSNVSQAFSYTGVFSRTGTLLSLGRTPIFKDLVITDEGQLYGISQAASDTVSQPITFKQMDLFLNLKREKHLGKQFVIDCKLSVTKAEEIVITGTSYTSNPHNLPKSPDGIYFYKEALTDIPQIKNTISMCSTINVTPNPATNMLHIESSDFNSTMDATIQIFDIVGKKMNDDIWGTQMWSKDMSSYPSGVYVVAIRNNSHVCSYKIIKE